MDKGDGKEICEGEKLSGKYGKEIMEVSLFLMSPRNNLELL